MVVPVIDLNQFPDSQEYKKLREASHEWGCFMLVNHKIPMTLMSEMKIVVRSLLDQPMEIKTKYRDNVIAGSGYLAPNKKNPHLETLGLYYDFGSSQAVETICSQLGASPYQRDVIWKYGVAMYEQIVDIGRKLGESLGLERDFLEGWPIMSRINKYNFTAESLGSIGVEPHTDSGFLTILQVDENVGGLEVMDKSGAFVPVHPCPGTLLVNFGDLAKAWSNGRLCNVNHRVQCREAAVRISIASFLFGPKEEALEAPPEFVDSEHPCLYVPFLSEEYRKLRLSMSLCGEALELLRIKS